MDKIPTTQYWRLAATLAAALLILSSAGDVSASLVDDLKAKIEERNKDIKAIEEEISRYKAQITDTERTATTLKSQLSIVNASISKLNADIRYTESRIGKTELQIEKILLEIGSKEKDIQSNRATLSQALRNMYELGSQSLVEVLLARAKLSDFFGELKYIEDLEGNVGDNLALLHQVKADLEGQEADYQDQKAQLTGLQDELNDRKIIAKTEYDNKNSLLKVTKSKEASYQKMLSDREKEREAIMQEIASIEDELRKLINPSALPSSRPGVLAWPVENPTITQGFGLTSFAQANSDVYKGGGHNGIDFRAAVGTPIYAAESGTVLRTGNSDLSCPGGSYGKWIVIEHPNNLATLYAHLSLIKVTDGEKVSRGQLIGYSGKTGYATGPHLHFTVYAAGTAGEIRFGPSSSGRCALLPFGGYLNPLDYL